MSAVMHELQTHLLGSTRFETETSQSSSRYALRHNKMDVMKTWLVSALQRRHAEDGLEPNDPWPTCYERLTETYDETQTYTPFSTLPNAVITTRMSAAAAIASANLRSVCTSTTLPPCKELSGNNQVPSETLTAIGSSLSGCSTSDMLSNCYSTSGDLSFEQRPPIRCRCQCDFILQSFSKYLTIMITFLAAIGFCLLVVYLRPCLRQHHRLPVDDPHHVNELIFTSSFISLTSNKSNSPSSINTLVTHSVLSIVPDLPNDLDLEKPLEGLSYSSRNLNSSVSSLDTYKTSIFPEVYNNPNTTIEMKSKVPSTHGHHLIQALQAPSAVYSIERWDLTLCVLLMCYILFSYISEQLPFLCFHESVVFVILGTVFGFLFTNKSDTVRFDFDLFNYVLLPPIMFGAGFTLKKTIFYRFIEYIASFGILLTLMLFMSLAYCLEWINCTTQFTTLDGQSINGLNFEIFLVLSAVLCCSDTVAYAVSFGEGIMNVVASIILSQSLVGVAQMRSQGAVVELPTSRLISELVTYVAYYLIKSSLVGVGFGLFVSLCFKRYHKAMNRDPIRAVSLILVASYMSYIFSEVLGFSAILAIFLCGVVTGHCGWYSLCHKGRGLVIKSVSLIVRHMGGMLICSTRSAALSSLLSYRLVFLFFELARIRKKGTAAFIWVFSFPSVLQSFVSEAFFFGYFGVAASNVVRHPEVFSPSLICWILFLLPICRCLATPIVYLLICIMKGGFHLALNNHDKILVLLGGMMRGTVSYALIINYVQQTTQDNHRNMLGMVLVSTVLGVLLSNILLFGIALPLISQWTNKRALIKTYEISEINDAHHLVVLALDSTHHHARGYRTFSTNDLINEYQTINLQQTTIENDIRTCLKKKIVKFAVAPIIATITKFFK